MFLGGRAPARIRATIGGGSCWVAAFRVGGRHGGGRHATHGGLQHDEVEHEPCLFHDHFLMVRELLGVPGHDVKEAAQPSRPRGYERLLVLWIRERGLRLRRLDVEAGLHGAVLGAVVVNRACSEGQSKIK